MSLTNSEVAQIAAELAREMIPALKEQLREEILTQVVRQVQEMERRQQAPRLLRLPEVCARVGYRPTKVWNMTAAGTFPQAQKLGPRVTVWKEHEVQAWIEQQAA